LICVKANNLKSGLITAIHQRVEANMSRQIVEENKARWALFEQVSPAKSAILWAAVGVIVALVVVYLYAQL
jgi:hypothetical protein